MARKTKDPPKEKTAAQLELERFDKFCAKVKAKSGTAKALETFKTPTHDDPRWTGKGSFTWNDRYVFVEAENYRIFPSKIGPTGKMERIVIYVDWAIVHVMNSETLKITGFRVHRHQGYWRFKTSDSVMRKHAGNKVSLLSPEGHALPDKQDGVTPHMGERDMLTRDLGAALGVAQDEASRLFFEWTGK